MVVGKGRQTASPFLKHGLPFMTFMVAGSFLLGRFVEGEKQVQGVKSRIDTEYVLKQQQQKKENKTLDDEYKNAMKTLNTENYENKPIPRPKHY